MGSSHKVVHPISQKATRVSPTQWLYMDHLEEYRDFIFCIFNLNEFEMTTHKAVSQSAAACDSLKNNEIYSLGPGYRKSIPSLSADAVSADRVQEDGTASLSDNNIVSSDWPVVMVTRYKPRDLCEK